MEDILMKYRSVIGVLILVLVVSLTACGNDINPFSDVDTPSVISFDYQHVFDNSSPALHEDTDRDKIEAFVDMLKACHYAVDEAFVEEDIEKRMLSSFYMAGFSRITVYEDGSRMVICTNEDGNITKKAYRVDQFDTELFREIVAYADENHVSVKES